MNHRLLKYYDYLPYIRYFFVSLHSNKNKNIQMLIIPVKEGESIEKALKKFKRKVEKTGLIKSLRERQKFTKPSVERRDEIKKAIYSGKFRTNA